MDYARSFSSNHGQMVRAVSLCILNKIHLHHLYMPDTNTATRYSIPHYDDQYRRFASISKNVIRNNYHRRIEIYSNRMEWKSTAPIVGNRSMSTNVESFYDGLSTLDRRRLEQMTETDLVSSSTS
jgi:hypothetical protein